MNTKFTSMFIQFFVDESFWKKFSEISMGPSKNKTSRETNQQRQKFVYNHFYFKKLFNSSKDSLYFCTLASFQTMVMYINTQLSIYWLEKRYRRPIKSKRYVIFLFLGRQFSSTEVIFLIFCIKYSDVLKRWILFDSLSVSVFRLSEVNDRFEGK